MSIETDALDTALVKPVGGYVHETGYADPPGPNSMRPTDH